MKVTGLNKYNGKKDLDSIVKYLTVDLSHSLRAIETILKGLDFTSNFKFFSKSVTLSPLEEVSVNNELVEIPSFFMTANSSDSDSIVTKGSTTWTKDKLYVKNQGSTSITVDVLFFK